MVNGTNFFVIDKIDKNVDSVFCSISIFSAISGNNPDLFRKSL